MTTESLVGKKIHLPSKLSLMKRKVNLISYYMKEYVITTASNKATDLACIKVPLPVMCTSRGTSIVVNKTSGTFRRIKQWLHAPYDTIQ